MVYNSPDAVQEEQIPYTPSPEQATKLFEMGQLDVSTAKRLGAQIDPAFVDATIAVESSNNPNAIGPVTKSGERARGLMQVMPATGAEVAGKLGMAKYDLMNKDDNRAIGQEYLAQQLKKYDGSMELASAAFNAGPGTVDKAIAEAKSNDPSKVIPLLPKETRAYVPKVMKGYQDRIGGTIEPEESQYAGKSGQQPSAKVLGVVSNVGSPAGTTPDPFTMKSEAVEYGSNVGIQRAQEEGAYLRERASQQEQMLQEQQQKEARRQEQIKEQELKAQQALDEFASAKVDPDRFWKNKGTGDKIIAGIAIALGAISQGITKSNSNQALDIINSQIDRDLEAQKIEILSKKEAASGQTGILAQMRARFDDERVAENMARVIGLDQAKLKLEEIASKSRSAEVSANRDLLLAQIEEERQKRLLEVQKAINESPQAQGIKRNMVVSGVQNPATGKNEKASPEILSEKDRERVVPGLGIATTEDDAKKLKEAQINFKKFDNLLGEIVESRQKFGAEMFGAEAEKQKARATEALLAIKNMETLGALDAGALKVGGRIIPENPAEFRWTGDPVAELKEIKRRAQVNFNEKIKSSLSMVSPEAEKQLNSTGSVSSFTPRGVPKG